VTSAAPIVKGVTQWDAHDAGGGVGPARAQLRRSRIWPVTGLARHRRDARLEALRALPIFAGLGDAALRRVDSQIVELAVAAGTVLVRQHAHGREALIIAEGCAAICVGDEMICTVGAGELIGEMALLDNGRRTATVTAVTAMRIYVLDPRAFDTLFDEPQTSRWIAARLATRLRVAENDVHCRAPSNAG
jgi:CRP/FNR family cyclic AMP-dependent transcriptional regulator